MQSAALSTQSEVAKQQSFAQPVEQKGFFKRWRDEDNGLVRTYWLCGALVEFASNKVNILQYFVHWEVKKKFDELGNLQRKKTLIF
ncbi:hypothetical protein GCM10025772_23650 [Ferrimonas gelatinilytica]|uniref:Uncharacterized protein n=1 Tax=Ferrimonas gelatinilytica TaxID=1255257 RepID=A0ABP9S9E4_9GAMM